jgi:hypothetical protein
MPVVARGATAQLQQLEHSLEELLKHATSGAEQEDLDARVAAITALSAELGCNKVGHGASEAP